MNRREPVLILTKRFYGALYFAAELHRSQFRKGTKIPYIGHLLAVTALVIEDGGSEDEAIGALLHDSIEDQAQDYPGGRDALRSYIEGQFGPGVVGIVNACTDDEGFEKEFVGTPAEEREVWLERKRKYAESIAYKNPKVLRVTAADKVHNVESIVDAHDADGPKVWLRFRTKCRQDQIDVYDALSKAIDARNAQFSPGERTGLAKRLSRDVYLMAKLT
jgi:(p)ppGpp synthase/HD superfamily hydrolase